MPIMRGMCCVPELTAPKNNCQTIGCRNPRPKDRRKVFCEQCQIRRLNTVQQTERRAASLARKANSLWRVHEGP